MIERRLRKRAAFCGALVFGLLAGPVAMGDSVTDTETHGSVTSQGFAIAGVRVEPACTNPGRTSCQEITDSSGFYHLGGAKSQVRAGGAGCWLDSAWEPTHALRHDLSLTRRITQGSYGCNTRVGEGYPLHPAPIGAGGSVSVQRMSATCSWCDSPFEFYQANIDLGFDFPFSGGSFRTASVTTAGFLNFSGLPPTGPSVFCFDGCSVPAAPPGSIYPYYDANKTQTMADIRVLRGGTAAAPSVTISWVGYGSDPRLWPTVATDDSFAVTLSGDGLIDFHYGQLPVESYSYARVGLTGPNGSLSTFRDPESNCLFDCPIEATDVFTGEHITWALTDPAAPSLVVSSPRGTLSTRSPTVLAQFNQFITPNSSISVTGPAGAVAGTTALQADLVTIVWNPSSSLPDGTYTVRVDAPDEGGGVGAASWQFTVDATGPVLDVISPSADASVQGTVPLEVTAADSSGISWITWSLRGSSVGGYMNFDPSSSIWKASMDSSTFRSGPAYLDFRAVDQVGNLSMKSVAITITGGVSRDYLPLSFSVTEGVPSAGGLSSIQRAYDGDEAHIASLLRAFSDRRYFATAWESSTIIDEGPASVSAVRVTLITRFRGSLSSGSQNHYLFNHLTQSWDAMEASEAGGPIGPDRIDPPFVIASFGPTSGGSAYVGSDGTIRFRVEALSTSPFDAAADLASIRVIPAS